MDERREMEAALGAGVVGELERRGLLCTVDLADVLAPSDLRLARTTAVVFGLAGGDVAATGRVGIATQMFVLSAEAWLDHGWAAPPALAEQLSRELHTLRLRGEAIEATVAARRAGAPWHLAGPASFGNGALSRAVAVGAALAGQPGAAATAASLDAVVTHAHRRAVAAASTLAALVAALLHRDPATPAMDVCRTVVAGSPVDVRAVLEQALAAHADPSELRLRHWGVTAPETLALALACALAAGDPADAVAAACSLEQGSHTASALAGALAGAIHGRVPTAWSTGVEGHAHYPLLARRLIDGLPALEPSSSDDVGADIWFLLDRSGSMSSIASDVVGGFEQFFAAQRATAGTATVTVVQFDDQDPHDVIVDRAPVSSVGSIAGRFEPRGLTPLYDAIGQMIDRAERSGGDDADQLVVVFTDGAENHSREWTHARLFERIAALRDRGWTFVFLGANQDSYATGGQVGFQAGNTSNFAPDAAGVHAAYDGLSRTVSDWRGKSRPARRRDRDDFWGGRKEAEDR